MYVLSRYSHKMVNEINIEFYNYSNVHKINNLHLLTDSFYIKTQVAKVSKLQNYMKKVILYNLHRYILHTKKFILI